MGLANSSTLREPGVLDRRQLRPGARLRRSRPRGRRRSNSVSADVPAAKIAGMRALGAHVHVSEQPGRAAREDAAAAHDRLLVVDGLYPEMAEGAVTIGLELEACGPIDLAVVQIGDEALISGVARWLKAAVPTTRNRRRVRERRSGNGGSFAAGRVVSTAGTKTIATALPVSAPGAQSLRASSQWSTTSCSSTRMTSAPHGAILETLDDPVEAAAQRASQRSHGTARACARPDGRAPHRSGPAVVMAFLRRDDGPLAVPPSTTASSNLFDVEVFDSPGTGRSPGGRPATRGPVHLDRPRGLGRRGRP